LVGNNLIVITYPRNMGMPTLIDVKLYM
jgi:hypothetical protein